MNIKKSRTTREDIVMNVGRLELLCQHSGGELPVFATLIAAICKTNEDLLCRILVTSMNMLISLLVPEHHRPSLV